MVSMTFIRTLLYLHCPKRIIQFILSSDPRLFLVQTQTIPFTCIVVAYSVYVHIDNRFICSRYSCSFLGAVIYQWRSGKNKDQLFIFRVFHWLQFKLIQWNYRPLNSYVFYHSKARPNLVLFGDMWKTLFNRYNPIIFVRIVFGVFCFYANCTNDVSQCVCNTLYAINI